MLPQADAAQLYDRFGRIAGADQQALSQAHIDLIGCGGLGGEVAHGLVRKGVGQLALFDHDQVEVSNLARQPFGAQDVGQPKATALAHILAAQATAPSMIDGYALSFQEALAQGVAAEGHLAVVAVDNQRSRIDAAAYYLTRRVPAIFLAVDDQAACGYVFVQTAQPGDPCFLCLYPDAGADRRIHSCAGASIEILKVVAGIALYAIDSLLMARARPWHHKTVYLDRAGDGHHRVHHRPDCPLCHGDRAESLKG